MDKRGLLLIATNLLLLAIFIYRIRRKKRIPNLVLMMVVIFFFLSIIEFSYRLFFSGAAYETGDCSKDFFRYDSSLGYVMNKTGSCIARKITRKGDTVYQATYTILPGVDTGKRPVNRRISFMDTGHARKVVFLGCSFTFGQGLDDSASLPWQLGKMNNMHTVNLGTTGYGIHQVYQLFKEQFDTTSNHQQIFVYSFLYDHILRANGLYDWNLQGPLFRMSGDSLVNTGPMINQVDIAKQRYIHYASLLGTFSFLKDMLGRVEVNARVRKLTQADYDKCFQMIRKMAEAIRRTGGQLIVVNWDNDNWANLEIKGLPVDMINKKLNDLAAADVQLVNVSSILDYNDSRNFIARDGHPAAIANIAIARHIARIINQQQ
jgi:hypothetical protein